jgi:hypothetical protein
MFGKSLTLPSCCCRRPNKASSKKEEQPLLLDPLILGYCMLNQTFSEKRNRIHFLILVLLLLEAE